MNIKGDHKGETLIPYDEYLYKKRDRGITRIHVDRRKTTEDTARRLPPEAKEMGLRRNQTCRTP